jgi:7-keto-8-aminopelargonate synthetase-like enzyme
VAAERATTDEGKNDFRRQQLARLVHLLREGLASLGFPVSGRAFPLVSIVPPDAAAARALYGWLMTRRVRALLRQARCRDRLSVSFSLTASHRREDVTRLLDVLATAPLAGWEQPS